MDYFLTFPYGGQVNIECSSFYILKQFMEISKYHSPELLSVKMFGRQYTNNTPKNVHRVEAFAGASGGLSLQPTS